MTREQARNLLRNSRPKGSNAHSLMLNEAIDVAIEALEQESKIGHWIKHTWDSFECSICHNEGGFYSERESSYCPDCGAKMEREV